MVINVKLLVLISSIALQTLGPKLASSSNIGVCFDTHIDDLPSPDEVVSMFRINHIGRMRLYEPDPWVFDALRGSGVQVTVGVHDQDIEQLANSYNAAQDWVNKYIRPYWPDVNFRYITVGNDLIPGENARFILPAMQNLHNSLRHGGLWHRIKVTTVVSPSVLDQPFPPSAASFSDRSIDYMEPIAEYLYRIGAPLLANVYPYFTFVQNPENVPLPSALFTARDDLFTDSGMEYRNLFDATVDAFYASLEKVGAPGVRVAVAETGWPAGGRNRAARASFARKYTSRLIEHVLSSQGTPKRPGEPIETYIFSLFSKRRSMRGASEEDFGLFYPDKRPVYKVNFGNAITN